MVKAKARYGYKGIVVDDCPFCHRTHRHNHPVGEGVRMAECFGGEYLLDFEAAEYRVQADECPVCGGAKYVLANDGNAIKCMPCNEWVRDL